MAQSLKIALATISPVGWPKSIWLHYIFDLPTAMFGTAMVVVGRLVMHILGQLTYKI